MKARCKLAGKFGDGGCGNDCPSVVPALWPGPGWLCDGKCTPERKSAGLASTPRHYLTLTEEYCLQKFENMAIVLCHFTSKYFLYLFGSWDYTHTKFASNG
jgi:hypothetical protein